MKRKLNEIQTASASMVIKLKRSDDATPRMEAITDKPTVSGDSRVPNNGGHDKPDRRHPDPYSGIPSLVGIEVPVGAPQPGGPFLD